MPPPPPHPLPLFASDVYVYFGTFCCIAVTKCGAPPVVTNASPSQNSGNYSDVIHYSCDAGYVQTGGLIGQMSCDASGSWVADTQYGETPACGSRFLFAYLV